MPLRTSLGWNQLPGLLPGTAPRSGAGRRSEGLVGAQGAPVTQATVSALPPISKHWGGRKRQGLRPTPPPTSWQIIQWELGIRARERGQPRLGGDRKMRPEKEPKREGRERAHILPPQHGTWGNRLSEAADVAKEIAAVGSGAFNHLCPES